MNKKKIVSFGQIEINPREVKEVDPECLAILPAIDTVMFPGVTIPITLSRPESVRLAEYAEKHNIPIGVICQKDPSGSYPREADELMEIGIIGQVLHIASIFDETKTAIVRALPRRKFEVINIVDNRDGILSAKVNLKNDRNIAADNSSFPQLMKVISQVINNTDGDKLDDFPGWADTAMSLPNDIDRLNFLATNVPSSPERKIEMLKCAMPQTRAKKLLEIMYENIEKMRIMQEVRDKAQENMGMAQRRAFMQQQYDVLHEQIFGDDDDDIERLKEEAAKSYMPDFARTIFNREIHKLERFNPQSPDYAVLQTYLETIVSLPWESEDHAPKTLSEASEILDADHYGMEDVKERVLEQIALTQRRNVKSPILCLVGPPGVGKTSLGRSIAEALGRSYQRVSLGGIHDESEIRGHRRTYIGAMPGRIIAAIQKSGKNNPLLLLDEIDKLGADYKGDPSAALLEVLDPEQNCHFHDNYIDIDFDLSNVFFIATANTLDTLSKPLLDRMEIIEMPGYLLEEKMEIARRHLIRSVRKRYDIADADFDVDADGIEYIIRHYTAESGVRQLEKRIAELARKCVLAAERGNAKNMPLNSGDVRELLGLEKIVPDDDDTVTPVGVVTGLAWTAIGGEILQIEASLSPSKTPKLTLTGNLGDVMKESAMLSLQYIRAHAQQLNIDQEIFEKSDIHIHVPEGAVPKDGPSAGITITTALVSLLTGRKVREHVAMTGEMTLRGKVLPVGGIREKILAAKRHGITDIYLSRRNERHVNDIKSELLKGLTFHYVDTIDQVLECLD